jgi:hypothetical protein
VIRTALSFLGATFALLSAVGGLVEVFQPAHSLLASEVVSAYLPAEVKPYLPFTLFGISAFYLLFKGSQLVSRRRTAAVAPAPASTPLPVPTPATEPVLTREEEVARRLLSRDEKERLKQQAHREAKNAIQALDCNGAGILAKLARAATSRRVAEEELRQAEILLEDSRRTLAEAVKAQAAVQGEADEQRSILRDALTFIPACEQSKYVSYLK